MRSTKSSFIESEKGSPAIKSQRERDRQAYQSLKTAMRQKVEEMLQESRFEQKKDLEAKEQVQYLKKIKKDVYKKPRP